MEKARESLYSVWSLNTHISEVISRNISLYGENMTAMKNEETTAYGKYETQDKGKGLMTFRLCFLLYLIERLFLPFSVVLLPNLSCVWLTDELSLA